MGCRQAPGRFEAGDRVRLPKHVANLVHAGEEAGAGEGVDREGRRLAARERHHLLLEIDGDGRAQLGLDA